jgi:hypothetical protein
MTIRASASPCLALPDSDVLLPAGMGILVVPFVPAMVGLRATTTQKLGTMRHEMSLR